MDKECISICEALNRLPGVTTYESCSGHGKEPFNVWFRCDNIDTLSRLGRVVDKRYSDGNWEIVLDSCDGDPRGCFWLRTKSILPNDELYDSLVNLERSILYWFQDDFDKYFNQDMAIEQPDAELVKSIMDYTVGDWVAAIDDEGDVTTEKIVSFSHNKVLLVDTDGCHTEYPKIELNGFRPWTIADAKDGDVLATDNGWSCIFKAFDGRTFSSYCFMDSQNWFYEFGSEVHTPDSRLNGNIHPATKEQCDLLFAKMKEAGYTWDEKKKELKKIPVKPQFKAGDWLWHKEKGVFPVLIAGYDEERGYLAKYIGSESYFGRDATENEYRLWTIADAKDGDVLVNGGFIFIFKNIDDGNGVHYYCAHEIRSHEEYEQFHIACFNSLMGRVGNSYTRYAPATKEQRDLLSQKMKEAGYQWDADKKELKKFPKHYDISNFKPKQWVLVRDCDNQVWGLSMFSHRDMGCYVCINRVDFRQCVPFEGNEHLLGTTDPCDEKYINW